MVTEWFGGGSKVLASMSIAFTAGGSSKSGAAETQRGKMLKLNSFEVAVLELTDRKASCALTHFSKLLTHPKNPASKRTYTTAKDP